VVQCLFSGGFVMELFDLFSFDFLLDFSFLKIISVAFGFFPLYLGLFYIVGVFFNIDFFRFCNSKK
jgi:hypothetical protein